MILLVVDTQKAITNDKLYQFDLFKSRVIELIRTARNNKIEVIFVRHDDGIGNELTKGNDGFEIYDGFQPLNGELIFDKNVNSAFKDTGLLDYLRQKEENTIIIVGLQTDYCIDATIKSEFDGGNEMFEELGISFGPALIVLLALYFIVKWAVRNGIKEAYRDITGKVTTEDVEE